MATAENTLPLWAPKRSLTAFLNQIMPVSNRTIEQWPIEKRLINRRLLFNRDQAIAYAQQLISSAPSHGTINSEVIAKRDAANRKRRNGGDQ